MKGLFEIDLEKCKRDGICAAVCPLNLITVNDDKIPVPIDKAEKQCVRCGHCVAVCPTGAFSLNVMTPQQCVSVNADLLPSAEQVKQLLTTRRSIRVYKKQPVDRETLAAIIDIARYAPSAVNIQPVKWLVVEEAAEVHRMAGLVVDWMRTVIEDNPEMAKGLGMKRFVADWESGKDRICRGAPHIIAAYANAALPVSPVSCTIALTYLELAAFSKGLGACWAGFFTRAAELHPPLKQILNLPEGYQVFGAMLIGYPQYGYCRVPLRKPAAIIWR